MKQRKGTRDDPKGPGALGSQHVRGERTTDVRPLAVLVPFAPLQTA